MALPIFTLGHSTWSVEDCLAYSTSTASSCWWMFRRFPGSRRLPHFRRDALAAKPSVPAGRLIYDGGAGQQAKLFD